MTPLRNVRYLRIPAVHRINLKGQLFGPTVRIAGAMPCGHVSDAHRETVPLPPQWPCSWVVEAHEQGGEDGIGLRGDRSIVPTFSVTRMSARAVQYLCYRRDTSHGEGEGGVMQKAIIALGLAGLLLAAGFSTASAATTVPPAKSVITSLNSDLTDVRWRRCWIDRWGRRRCQWCWRDRWGRVRCS